MSIARLFDLSGQVAVVTGAGRGIGEGIAHILSEAGAAVVLADCATAEVEKVTRSITDAGRPAIAVSADITDQAAIEALAEQAVKEFGGLDVWINNAGGSPVRAPLTEITREVWDAVIDLNLTSVWMNSVVAAKRLREGGRIVNISSAAGHGPMPGSGHYAAAKAGVNNLTQTLAIELAPRVRVNAVSPGVVPTEVTMASLGLRDSDLPALEKGLRLPLRRLGTPADLAAAVLYFASSASNWVTGQVLKVTGGM